MAKASPIQRQAQARAAREARFNTRLEWFGDKVMAGLKLTMRQRVTLAVQLLRDKVVINVSKPVTKTKGKSGRIKVSDRSKPGEFPRADTTRLMKDIFSRVDVKGNEIVGTVGTTLDYGLILETEMDRSFLVRTLRELRSPLTRILTEGAGGGGRVAGL
jgi:hypothetical protein